MTATVLLLEDDPALLDLLRIVIEGWGHRALLAPTPGEALRQAHDAARIDVVLADVGLLRRAGSDLVGQIRAAHPGLRPVYMSGHAAEPDAPGESPFLQKPFALSDLETVLTAALDA